MARPVQSTLVNGNRPSFVEITVSVAGKDQARGAFLSIDYEVQQQPGEIYSKSRADLVGTTPGYTKATGSFEMLVSEANGLFSDLTGLGALALTTPSFDITVAYSSNAIDVQTDKLLGCRITSLNASNKGTSATTRSVNFLFNQLVTDGIVIGGDAAVVNSNGLDGQTPITTDFWYQPVYAAPNGDWVCPGFIGETYSKEPWDAVFVPIPYSGTEQPYTPGICEVTCTKERTVDKKKAKGSDGARITVHGIELAEGEIEITIWTPQQFRTLMDMWPLLFPGPQKFTTTKTVSSNTTRTEFAGTGNENGIVSGQTFTIPQTPQTKRISVTQIQAAVRPFSVSHPKFKMLGVSQILFVAGSGPDPGPSPFARVFKMKWVEFNPPVKDADSTSTPAASKASTFEPSGYQTPGSNPKNSNLVN